MPLILALALQAAQPASPPSVADPLDGLAFLLGHCWRGEIAPGVHDTHCFEPAYPPHFVRDRHEVTGGYAGETLYSQGRDAPQADYVYWSTTGGVSRGSMRVVGGVLDFGDEVHRGADGRESRIATTWRQVAPDAYEVRVTSAVSPGANRVIRYNRVAPEVRITDTRGPDGRTAMTHELVIPAPPADVYRALATAEGWRTWAVPLAWEQAGDQIETSYATGARPGDPRNIRQHFLLRVPDRLIAWRTVRTPAGFPHAEAFMAVTSIAELEPVAGGTRVRLTGAGYPAGAAGETLLGFFRDGNRTSLEQLRSRFASGPIDWTARSATGH